MPSLAQSGHTTPRSIGHGRELLGHLFTHLTTGKRAARRVARSTRPTSRPPRTARTKADKLCHDSGRPVWNNRYSIRPPTSLQDIALPPRHGRLAPRLTPAIE